MPQRLWRLFEFIIISLFTIVALKPTPALADTVTACFTNEDPTYGGVTRGDALNFDINLNLPITSFYCSNPDVPVVQVIEGNENQHLNVGTNCPDANTRNKILTELKAKIAAITLTPEELKTPSVKTQADFQGDTTWKLLRPPSDITPDKVNNITGQTALNTVGTSKIYYAACTNVPEVGPIWFSMTGTAPTGKVFPSYRKESAASFYLQNYISQVPGDDPVIKQLKSEAPVFNDNNTPDLLPFPKLSFKMASRKISDSDYLIYWKICSKKGPVDPVKNISCQLSNFITDIESNNKSLVAEIPNDAWGKATGGVDGNQTTCFTTGDFDTHPLKVSNTAGNSYTLTAKLVGTPSDDVACQNNAYLYNTVYLDQNNALTYSGYSTTPQVAPCNGATTPTSASSPLPICIGGDCHITAIAKFFNDAADKITNLFNTWIHTTSPAANWDPVVNPVPNQVYQSCDQQAENLCNPKDTAGSASDHLKITQVISPTRLQIGDPASSQPVTITVSITNLDKINGAALDYVTSTISDASAKIISPAQNTQSSPPIFIYGNTVTWGKFSLAPGDTTSVDYTALVQTGVAKVIKVTSQVSAPYQKPVTYYSQTNFSCVKVAGAGTNTCSNNGDCSSQHLSCNNGTGICEVTPGPGSNTCNSNPSCKDDREHLSCLNNACVAVPGAGTDSCSKLSDCVTTTHSGCSADTKTCGSFSGSGPNNCANDAICSSDASQTHMECSSQGDPYKVTQTVQETPYINSAFTVSYAETVCKQLAKIICYVGQMPGYMASYSYNQDLKINVYPYPEASYTQAIDSQAASPKDGYFNAFLVPGQNDKISLLNQKDVDSKANLTTLNKQPTTTTTDTKDISIKGSQQTQAPLTYLWQNAFCPPGQQDNCPKYTAGTESLPSESVTNPDTPPLPGPIIPGTNIGFYVPACSGGSDIAIAKRSNYTLGILSSAATTEGVPANLLAAILMVETGNNALSSVNGTSPACATSVCSARGWFQITSGADNVTCSNTGLSCTNYCCGNAVCPSYQSAFDPPYRNTPYDLCDPADAAKAAAYMLRTKMGFATNHTWTADESCQAAARYFGADASSCETSGGYYERLANCTYGMFVKKFVSIAGLQ